MNFAAPFAFGLSALGVAVVILYILKVRRRPVVVPYLRLWQALASETRTVTLFKRLKRLLSLLLQLAILALLLFAIARPSWSGDTARNRQVILLLDASASMTAKEAGGKTRFELMVEKAKQLIESRDTGDDWMLAAASDRVDVLSSFTTSTIRLREALQTARPTLRSLDVEQSFAFAREVARDKKAPLILFLSDGHAGLIQGAIDKLATASAPAGGSGTAHWIPIGESVENVGIIRFSARKNSSLGTDYVLAVVKNFGDHEREFKLEFSLNNVTQKILPKKLGPGEECTENLQFSMPRGGTLKLSIAFDANDATRDALDADNVAYAIVVPDRLRRVVLVTESADAAIPFRIAFESMQEVVDESSAAFTVEEYSKLSPEDRQADVTICHNAVPEGLPQRGNVILIHTPLPSFVPAQISGEDATPVVLDWDREHVLNRYLNFREMKLPSAKTIRSSSPSMATIVDGGDSPLIAAFDLSDRKAIYVAFDMTSQLFPFRLAFPMLLRNAIAWFETEEDVLFEDSYAVGSVIAPLRKIHSDKTTARYFAGTRQITEEIPVTGGTFTFTKTEETGPIYFRFADREHATAINLFDANESRIAPSPQKNGDTFAIAGGFRIGSGELWTWFALAALALWALEWATYHRRITE
jgi:hypothetical protein